MSSVTLQQNATFPFLLPQLLQAQLLERADNITNCMQAKTFFANNTKNQPTELRNIAVMKLCFLKEGKMGSPNATEILSNMEENFSFMSEEQLENAIDQLENMKEEEKNSKARKRQRFFCSTELFFSNTSNQEETILWKNSAVALSCIFRHLGIVAHHNMTRETLSSMSQEKLKILLHKEISHLNKEDFIHIRKEIAGEQLVIQQQNKDLMGERLRKAFFFGMIGILGGGLIWGAYKVIRLLAKQAVRSEPLEKRNLLPDAP